MPWVFLFFGLAFLTSFAATALVFSGRQGWLNQDLHEQLELFLAQARVYLPSEEWLRYLAWLGGIAGSAIGAAFTLLASWHFAEMNLPRRLQELKDAHKREHLALQPALLDLARRGLGPVVPDIEASRFTLLRKWLSRWSEKEGARVLAASAKRLQEEQLALSAAVEASQHQQITAHLIRGYQFASQGDAEKALEEFDAAAAVRMDDIISRDIAAGWARKVKKPTRELEHLKQLQQAASSRGEHLHQARALRREAELLDMRKLAPDWIQARNRLNDARELLQPLAGDLEGRLELGRVLTLLCEVQCSRTVVGRLASSLTAMRNCMSGVAMHSRPEEPDGEVYGEARAEKVEQRAAELRFDVVSPGDSSDQ